MRINIIINNSNEGRSSIKNNDEWAILQRYILPNTNNPPHRWLQPCGWAGRQTAKLTVSLCMVRSFIRSLAHSLCLCVAPSLHRLLVGGCCNTFVRFSSLLFSGFACCEYVIKFRKLFSSRERESDPGSSWWWLQPRWWWWPSSSI